MKRDSAMVIKADARAMSAVTALDTRVSERWTASVPNQRKFNRRKFTGTSECISYKLDDKSDAKVFAAARKSANKRTKGGYDAVDLANKRPASRSQFYR